MDNQVNWVKLIVKITPIPRPNIDDRAVGLLVVVGATLEPAVALLLPGNPSIQAYFERYSLDNLKDRSHYRITWDAKLPVEELQAAMVGVLNATDEEFIELIAAAEANRPPG